MMSDLDPLLPSQPPAQLSNEITIGTICTIHSKEAILWSTICCFSYAVTLEPNTEVEILGFSKKVPVYHTVQVVSSSNEAHIGKFGTIRDIWLEPQSDMCNTNVENTNADSVNTDQEDVESDNINITPITEKIRIKNTVVKFHDLEVETDQTIVPIEDNSKVKLKPFTQFLHERSKLSASKMNSKFRKAINQVKQYSFIKSVYKTENKVRPSNEVSGTDATLDIIEEGIVQKEEIKEKDATTSILTDLNNLEIGSGQVSAVQVHAILETFRFSKCLEYSSFFTWLLKTDRTLDSFALGPILTLLPREGPIASFGNMFRQMISAVSSIQVKNRKLTITFLPDVRKTYTFPSQKYLVLNSGFKSDPTLVHPLNTVTCVSSKPQTFIVQEKIKITLSNEGITEIESGNVSVKYGMKFTVNVKTQKDKNRIEIDEYGRKILELKDPKMPVTISNVATSNGHYLYRRADYWLVLNVMSKDVWIGLRS